MVRLAGGILFFYTLYRDLKILSVALLLFFVLLDILDGYVARKLHCTSDLGIVLDHGTDKLFAVVTLIVLFVKDVIPPTVFFAFILRDIALSIGWIVVRIKKKRFFSSKFYGKVAGGCYFLVIFLYLVDSKAFVYPVMLIALVLYYLSAFYYARDVLQNKEVHYAE